MGLVQHSDVDGIWGHSLAYTNAYGGNLGSEYFFVVAGSDLVSPQVGEISVTRRNAVSDDGKSSSFTLQDTTGRHGALTISSTSLPMITLTASDGTTYQLNVAAKKLTATAIK